MITCKNCGREYNASVLSACPACQTPMGSNAPPIGPGPSAMGAPSPTAPQEIADWESLIEAQLSTTAYVRAGVALLFAVIISTSFVALGNQAEQQKFLSCLGEQSCSAMGGGVYYAIGAIASGVIMVLAARAAAAGKIHRKRAGG